MVQDNTTGNPLSAGSLALFMATSLPKGDGPQLKNGTEAVALAIHAGMLAVGFRLIGLGEDERIGETTTPTLHTPDSTLHMLLLLSFVAAVRILKYS
jgi:hypothetical protein